MFTDETAPRSGDVIGQECGGSYRIISLLGEGGMGQVYMATSELLAGKPAAVKVLHADMMRRPEILARFRAEVFAAGKINDENIVKVFDAGHLRDGRMYMLMEYCPEGSLDALIAQRQMLPLPLVLSIAARVGSALWSAHAVRITHRDLKPANILLMREAGVTRAKLTDFGIAKFHEDAGKAGMTATQKILGSPGYMSPEQCRGAGLVDHRADIYSFGVVLYEMVTGRRPYMTNSAYELVNATAKGEPFPRPRELRPDLPRGCDEIIMWCLAHNREARAADIKDVVSAFARDIPNGEFIVSVAAPKFARNELPPGAETISDGVGVVAPGLAISTNATAIRARRRSLAALAIGATVGSVATATVTLGFMHRSPDAVPTASAQPPSRDAGGLVVELAPTDAPAVTVTAPAADAASIAVTLDAATADAPRIAAAPPDASPPAPRPDAAVPTTVAADRPRTSKPSKPRTTPAVTEYGKLQVDADPWATVEIPGQEPRPAPFTIDLPVGTYRITLVKGNDRSVYTARIKANETFPIKHIW